VCLLHLARLHRVHLVLLRVSYVNACFVWYATSTDHAAIYERSTSTFAIKSRRSRRPSPSRPPPSSAPAPSGSTPAPSNTPSQSPSSTFHTKARCDPDRAARLSAALHRRHRARLSSSSTWISTGMQGGRALERRGRRRPAAGDRRAAGTAARSQEEEPGGTGGGRAPRCFTVLLSRLPA